MEAPEVPTEHLHETMEHHAHSSGERWIMGVALSSAIIAGLAAIASLLAGANANEAMIAQMQASDQWNYYQAKGVKANVLASKLELLTALGKTPETKDSAKLAGYKQEQEKIKTDADHLQKESRERLETHEIMARSVTMFQIAIAVAAISVLTKRRAFWYVGLAASAVGIVFLTQGLLSGRGEKEPEHEDAASASESRAGPEKEKAKEKEPEQEKPFASESPAAEQKPAAPETPPTPEASATAKPE